MNTRFTILLGLFLLTAAILTAQTRNATLLDHKDRIRIAPVDVLNSPFRETNLSITPDGKYMYFMSLRGGQYWSRMYMTYGRDSVFDGDIWFSKKMNGKWQPPQCLPYGINTENGEDEPNISPGGSSIFYQSWRDYWQFDGGPYYHSKIVDGKLKGAEGLGGGITEFFKTFIDATDGMAVSPDGRKFVVACGRGYNGNMDIFLSLKGPTGWSYCRKLDISTYGDDRSVFLAADGRTLYFASDGYEGFGGLDIFKTTLNPDGTTGEVINLGKPFNTAGDDYSFILTGDGNEGYFIRNGDIHFADLTEADEKLKPLAGIGLKGTVKEKSTNLGLQANVVIFNAQTKAIVKKFKTTTRGTYNTSLPNRNGIYDLVAMRNGYIQHKRRLKIAETSYQQSFEAHFVLDKKQEELVVIPDPPPIAENKPKPTVQDEAVKPADPVKPDLNELATVKPKPEEKKPPKPTPVEIKPEKIKVDPYSFEGVAENNLVLLIDVSASMKDENKLPLMKKSLKKLIGHMRSVDRISIVTYSSNAEVVLDGLPATRQIPIRMAIDDLRIGGSTRSKSALKKAYKVAEDHFITNGNNRIILATDGNFDIAELNNISAKGSAKGVRLSIFSFGKMGKDRLGKFSMLAENGKGNHTNITPANVDETLLKEAKAVRKKE